MSFINTVREYFKKNLKKRRKKILGKKIVLGVRLFEMCAYENFQILGVRLFEYVRLFEMCAYSSKYGTIQTFCLFSN